MRQDRWFFAECLACLKHLYYLCAIQMDRYARGAAPMGCALAQGGSRGRAGSSWFLSLRLRLAINVFSCIFSNGVMRNAPRIAYTDVSLVLSIIYIPHRRSPPVTLIRTCLSNKAAGISSYLQTERTSKLSSLYPPGGVTKTDIEAVPSLSPSGVTKRTSCTGDRLVTAGWL